jgi:hypothetical protein
MALPAPTTRTSNRRCTGRVRGRRDALRCHTGGHAVPSSASFSMRATYVALSNFRDVLSYDI